MYVKPGQTDLQYGPQGHISACASPHSIPAARSLTSTVCSAVDGADSNRVGCPGCYPVYGSVLYTVLRAEDVRSPAPDCTAQSV